MTPERWQQVKELLAAVLEQAPDRRSAFLDGSINGDEVLRAEVESLLAHEETGDSMVESSRISSQISLARAISGEFLSEQSGHSDELSEDEDINRIRRVGPYKTVRELGRGGVGWVLLAERDDDEYRQRVAIKLIRRGMDTDFVVRRFRNERQILAALDHPNIGRLIDGGTTENDRPYLVMEYVEGLPIDVYCDQHRLSAEGRLKLFRQVCAAVHYAHQHLVIHRDIKPSNVLVTKEGVPKLLDFGIAKLLTPALAAQTLDPTLTAMRLLTPAYASPEQVKGTPITAASDVYSLGVLLYELLTGHKPYRVKASYEIAHAVLEEEPTRPSTVIDLTEETVPTDGALALTVTPNSVSKARETTPERLRKRLRGDLDNILLMALRKDPKKRYASVELFSEDIRRHLVRLPVTARGDSLLYRTNKFIHRSRVGVVPMGISLVVVALLALFTYAWISRSSKPSSPDLKIQSLAVLPFKDSGNELGNQYLGTGIAETIASDLTNSRQITVRPVRASLRYPSMSQTVVDAGRALQVDAVLQGTVTKEGDKLRVTSELIRTKDGARLWQNAAEIDSLLVTQDSITSQVAHALALDLSEQERARVTKRKTNNVEAYHFYLRARHLFAGRKLKDLPQAIECFQQAIKIDPNYAEAYAGLAHAYILGVSQLEAIERMRSAKVAAEKALTLDNTLAEAHMALGRALAFCDWDWAGSERAFKQAITLSPNYSDAHFWYSHNLTALGRHDEALAELKLAFEIDPFFSRTVLREGQALYLARRYDRAIEGYLRTPFEVDAAYYQVYWRLGLAYAQKGMYADAISMLKKAQTLSEDLLLAKASLAYVYAKSDNRRAAEKLLGDLEQSGQGEQVPWMMMAGAYGDLGDTDNAIRCLENLYNSRDAPVMHLKVDPVLDNIRSDPRYNELLRRVGLS